MANPNSIVQAQQIQNLLVIDPSAKGMENVNVEDLSISVELEVYKRDENPIIFSNGEVTTGNKTNPEATRISFIDGAGEGDYLTTHYTELTTDFGKDKDVGSLGIETIDISFNTSYVPIVKIKFKDIRARLFEMGDESPYSFLFKMPYPIFYLTVKGYYGKPVKYALHLTKFNGQLDNDTGSFIITCDFIGYTYAFLADLLMGVLKGTPYTQLGQSLTGSTTTTNADGTVEEFVTFDQLTAVVSQLQENIGKFNDKNKPLRALLIFKDLNDKLDVIKNNLISTITNLNPAYKVGEDTSLDGANYVSWGGAVGAFTGSLNTTEQEVYGRDVLDLVEGYINLNNEKGIDTYKLNKDDFELNNGGVWLSNYSTSDFIFDGGVLNSLPKTFEEFQTNSSLTGKYPHYSSIGDDYSEKKYNNFIKLVNNKSQNTNNFSYEFKDSQSLFDIRFAIDKIDDLKNLIVNDYKQAKKEVTDSFVDGITDYLESDGSVFDASIGSLFRILCGHVDLFVNVIKKLEKQIKDDVTAGQRNIREADKNNFSEYADAEISNVIPVNAFPEYIEQETLIDSDGRSNTTLVEKWLGSNLNYINYKEVEFIDDLYASMIKAAEKDRDALEKTVFIEKGWFPVNPIETKAFDNGNTNPWEIAKNAVARPIVKLIVQRMSLFLGYSNRKLTDKEIVNMAIIEANQLNEAVLAPNVKKSIVQAGITDTEINTKVLAELGNGLTDFGLMGSTYDLKLYFDDPLGPDNAFYIYTHGVGDIGVDGANLGVDQNIPITQSKNDLDSSEATAIYGGTSLVSNGDNEIFIKIIPYDTYKQTYQHANWIGGNEPSIITTKTTRKSDVSNVNNIFSGIYKTHEFSKYKHDELGEHDLSYEFYDKELKTSLLQNSKDNYDPFSHQSKLTSNSKDYSLFGTNWYYNQTEVGKALLFLHSIPFDGVNLSGIVTGANNEQTHGILSDKNLKFFNERAGFVLVPESWLLLLGGLLYRESITQDIIKFSENGVSLVPNIDDININTSQYIINYLDFDSNRLYSNGAINFESRNITAYSTISNVILRLPNSVKDILINNFTEWVSGGWLQLKTQLELFNVDGNGNMTTTKPIISDNYGEVVINDDGTRDLVLTDNTVGSDALNVFLKSKKILMNSTFRIWEGSNTDYRKISFLSKDYKLYLTEFYKKLSELNGDKQLDTKSEIQRQLFNTDNVDDIKLSLYKNIKSIYNKWIVGVNPTVDPVILHDLYKSFNFLDRAHIDISNNFKISPTKFVEFLSTNSNISFYNFIARILRDNNFDFIPLPTFLDYSSAEKIQGVFEPQRFKDMAATNGPQFICMYFGEQSNKLNISKKDDRGDSFSIPSKYNKDGDLIISDFDDLPEDFVTGNRTIPYFLVNYADQNQSLFKNISLNQAEFTETNESLEIIESLSRRNRNNSIGQNLFDIYSNRAYSAEVEMLGNAQIQPFMFFQINNIPMFDGAYTIINTRHHIKANHMTTTFKGVRIRKVKTKMIDNDTLYAHLLANLNEVDNDDASLNDIAEISGDNSALPESDEGIPDNIKGTFVNPLADIIVVSDFGGRTLRGNQDYHGGTDFRAAVGTDVKTVTDVTVYRVRREPNGNLYVDFKAQAKNGIDADFYIRYMHLSELTHPQLTGFDVSTNDVSYFPTNVITIPKDTVFGKTGNSGGVTAHLHMDIRNDAAPKPDEVFKKTQWFFDTSDWKFKSNQQKLDKTVTT